MRTESISVYAYLLISRFSAIEDIYFFHQICRAWFNAKIHAVYVSNKLVNHATETVESSNQIEYQKFSREAVVKRCVPLILVVNMIYVWR